MTTQDGPFCPFADPRIAQSATATFAPTPVADGWEFEDSNGYGKGFRMAEFLHEVTKGGLTWVSRFRFDTNPATRGDDMHVFQFRTPSEDRTAGLYTASATGNLVFEVCISVSCERVTTGTPVAGVWMVVATRYVHGDRRMELWVDGELVSWADTLAARAQVRLLCCSTADTPAKWRVPSGNAIRARATFESTMGMPSCMLVRYWHVPAVAWPLQAVMLCSWSPHPASRRCSSGGRSGSTSTKTGGSPTH